MHQSPVPEFEETWLEILRQYGILDFEPELAFDDLTQIASQICQVPIALISFADRDRHWLKSSVGLQTSAIPRNIAFCTHTLLQPEPLVIPDATQDERFAHNPLVLSKPQIRFYAGVALVIDEQPIGSLCVMDRVPRQLTPAQLQSLQALGRQVVAQLQLRKNLAQAQQAIQQQQQVEIAQKQSEDLLRESEERWQLALRGNNDGIWDWNIKTNQVFYSPRWKEMLGYAEDEIVGNRNEWRSRVHPDDLKRVTQLIQAHFEHQMPFYISEHRLRCKDGSYKWILDRGQALWDDDGNVVRMAGSHTDITERKQAEKQLRLQSLRSQLFAEISLKIRQSLHLNDILQTAVDEVQKIFHADRVVVFQLGTDGTGQVVKEAIAPGWRSLLKLSVADRCFGPDYFQQYGQGRSYSMTDRDQDGVEPCLADFMHQIEVKSKLVMPISRQGEFWGLLIAHQCSRPRHWSDFEVDLMRQLADQIGIALTQAYLLEQETRQRQELARSNADLEQFAYVASHDLQEPLRMVASYLQLIERRYKKHLDQDAEEFITYAVEGATRMQALINDLLSYSRIGTRGQPFKLIDSNAILKRVLDNLRIASETSQAVITSDPLPHVVADTTQLTQLFQNLISNAMKFRGEDPPRIHITAQNEAGAWRFAVHDNGIGIDMEYGDRIFLIFQRLHNRAQYSGTGIGLAICKKIVERHDGQIWVESKPGEGSTFFFTLPDRREQTT